MNFLSNIIKRITQETRQRVYLDYASLTSVDPRVIKTVARVTRVHSANPSSLYAEGVTAEKLLNKSRAEVARFFEANPDEIVFTSGGTEANNLAIKGIINGAIAAGVARPHVISLAIEHPSIKELLSSLESNGKISVTYVPVDAEGIVNLKEFKTALRTDTVLVTIMYANNEVGVIQPIHEIAKAIRAFRKENASEYPYFHTDACQAAAYCSMRVPALGIDLMTIDGGKVYGPRGIGALYIRRGVQKKLVSEMIGGSQENDFRAGTENLPAIAGLTQALQICAAERESEFSRLTTMRDRLIEEIKKIVPSSTLNGHAEQRLPNNINICIPGSDAEFLVLRLDAKGICVSSVTSCRSKAEDSSSYVIEEMGKKECAASSLRITLGRFTTKSEIQFFLKQLSSLKI
jgi:cysteine desulfurase